MQSEYIPISTLSLSLMVIPLILLLVLFSRLKIRLLKRIFISVSRMVLQLTGAGASLIILFRWNNSWINFFVFLTMVIFAAHSVTDSSRLSARRFFFPVATGMFLSVLPLTLFTSLYVLKAETFFDIRYFVVIAGMVLGNMLRSSVIAHSSFFKEMKNSRSAIEYRLSLGASNWEAVRAAFGRSLTSAMEPQLASMMTTGIVFLPGMMTGQILSGISPLEAVRYQVLIMILIFSGAGIGGSLALYLSWREFLSRQNTKGK